LPARRNILPKPCPECGSNYGSIRIAVLTGTTHPVSRSNVAKRVIERGAFDRIVNDEDNEPKSVHGYGRTVSLVRIKHYNASGYFNVKNSLNSKPMSDEVIKSDRKKLMANQQKWCSFRIDENFIGRFEPITKELAERFERLRERKSFDFRPNDSFLEAVKKYGWNDLPRSSSKYHRVTRDIWS